MWVLIGMIIGTLIISLYGVTGDKEPTPNLLPKDIGEWELDDTIVYGNGAFDYNNDWAVTHCGSKGRFKAIVGENLILLKADGKELVEVHMSHFIRNDSIPKREFLEKQRKLAEQVQLYKEASKI